MKLLEKILPIITAIWLPALLLFGVLIYFGKVDANFSLLLFIAFMGTGLYWLAEKFYFLPERKKLAATAAEGADREAKLAQPWWLDWTAGLFPVIAVVFLLRSFFFEPFKIPSGSMLPTLEVGDFILVNKYTYGIRLPVINKKIIDVGNPQRGDVMVFRYPLNENRDYIKRVIGIPGDEVRYINKRLTVNGKELAAAPQSDYLHSTDEQNRRRMEMVRGPYSHSFAETVHRDDNTFTHSILNDDEATPYIRPESVLPGAVLRSEHCQDLPDGLVCKVPAGHYFMMGDNRDSSEDSRYWGFVPDKNIVGKAVFVWMHWGKLDRIGKFD